MLDDKHHFDGHLSAGRIEAAHFLYRDRLLVDVGDQPGDQFCAVKPERPIGSDAPVAFADAGRYLTASVRPLRVVSIFTSPGVCRIATVTGPIGVPERRPRFWSGPWSMFPKNQEHFEPPGRWTRDRRRR